MKFDDLLTYITKETVRYMETPREDRKRNRRDVRASREAWDTRWFGLIPLALRMAFPRRKHAPLEPETEPTHVSKP